MLSSLSCKTQKLVQTPLFKPSHVHLDVKARTKLVYERARAIAQVYDLTLEDVAGLTEKFWEVTADHISAVDTQAMILLSIQCNLAAGTLAPYAESRPELRPLLKQILDFNISAQFLLTELGHGLDARHLETTATLLPSGEYDLHTPSLEAAKFMPPTGLVDGLDRVGIVVARLIVCGEDRGLRAFIVPISNNNAMCQGVTSRRLPGRPGTETLDLAITSFNHVLLPHSALLGSHDKPTDPKQNFLSCIHRAEVGSLSMSLVAIPALSVSAYIAAKYSLSRTIPSPSGTSSLWSLRTQQIPILRAFAQVAVMKAFAREAICLYKDYKLDHRVRAGIATCVKAFFVQQSQESLVELSEACGAQGLFFHDQITSVQLAMRGMFIAEGDMLALCIRLASELLIGRYGLPAPRYPSFLLALHEASILKHCQKLLKEVGGDHRSEAFNRRILPLCRPLVEAISYRMAYEAALDSGVVHKPLLDLFEAAAVRRNGAWFAQHQQLNMCIQRQQDIEEAAVTAALPFVERYMNETEAAAYAQAPGLTKESLSAFVEGLEHFDGKACSNLARL
ncbi:acyl-CoA dehydrogenase NM domain-like protein [Schizopora paradoxa]|uniref:Acyl-CoA dehydrogenase NM domain-like protein n=1 Tax=Schizopora paradoxa TaxID=27342 RepID=A0A0H2RTZ5_9AGAM|nr:acyl-CoA dehydrogenase NM domain-like protein [Schizopora paradoxa]